MEAFAQMSLPLWAFLELSFLALEMHLLLLLEVDMEEVAGPLKEPKQRRDHGPASSQSQ